MISSCQNLVLEAPQRVPHQSFTILNVDLGQRSPPFIHGSNRKMPRRGNLWVTASVSEPSQ
jgi:hypothetical protein